MSSTDYSKYDDGNEFAEEEPLEDVKDDPTSEEYKRMSERACGAPASGDPQFSERERETQRGPRSGGPPIQSNAKSEPTDSIERIDLHEDFDILSISHTNYGGEDGDIRALRDVSKILRITLSGSGYNYFYKSLSNDDESKYSIKKYSEGELKRLFESKYFRGLYNVRDLDDGDYEFDNGTVKKTANGPFTLRKKSYYSIADFLEVPCIRDRLEMLGFKFYSKDVRYYSIFNGYATLPAAVEVFSMFIIQPILDHWLTIISSNGVVKYNWFLDWYASFVQDPAKVTGYVLFLFGGHGAGKNVFCTDILCDLIGDEWTESNCLDAGNVFGHFNSLAENKKLIVLNETKSSEDRNNNFDVESFKGAVTGARLQINPKNEKQYTVQNVMNVIIISNNPKPFNISQGERRIVRFNVDNRYAESIQATDEQIKARTEYFNKLAECKQNPLFKPCLMKFFMDRDLTAFNANNGRPPLTEETLEFKDASKTPMDEVFEDNILKFINGFDCKDIYADYCERSKERGRDRVRSQKDLIAQLAPKNNQRGLVNNQRTRPDPVTNKRERYLIFNDDGIKMYGKLITERLKDDIAVRFEEYKQRMTREATPDDDDDDAYYKIVDDAVQETIDAYKRAIDLLGIEKDLEDYAEDLVDE